jgi:hypothetical protein
MNLASVDDTLSARMQKQGEDGRIHAAIFALIAVAA